MTRCRFGYPERPGSKIVFFCDDDATDTFTQLVPNSGGCTVNVPVCDAHAEHLVVLARETAEIVEATRRVLHDDRTRYDLAEVERELGDMGRKPDCPREALVVVNVLRRGGYLAVCQHCKWDGTTYGRVLGRGARSRRAQRR